MTIEEAQQIADIASYADGGCESCVEGMRRSLQEQFPEFVWSGIEPDYRWDSPASGRRIIVSMAGQE